MEREKEGEKGMVDHQKERKEEKRKDKEDNVKGENNM